MKRKQEVLIRICQEALEPFGFDLVKPFNVQDYNKLVLNPKNKLKMFPNRKKNLGILFGNTRRLWTPFMKEYHESLYNESDPLDRYTENVFCSLQSKLQVDSFLKFSHDIKNGDIIAIQKICQISGLGFNEESIGLCIHPTFGPWFALRCVLVVDEEFEGDIEEIKQFPGSAEDLLNMRIAMKNALKTGNWLEIRNSCELGKEFRYSKEQIDYHYYRKMNNLEFKSL